MRYCYNCFRELDLLETEGICPFCHTPFARQEFSYALPCGSILNGRYIIGYERGTHFAQSYNALDWKESRRVIVWEFFPFDHVPWNRYGFETENPLTVTYRVNERVSRDSPEREPSYWLKKFEALEDLTRWLSTKDSHFPKYLNSFLENNTAYYVTEFVEGETLEEYLQGRGGCVTWTEALRLLAPVADALDMIHQRDMIHGNVSPEKIVLTRDGTIKLLDAGARYAWDDYIFTMDDDLYPFGWEPYHVYMGSRKMPVFDICALASCFYRAVAGAAPASPIKNETHLPLPEGREGCFPAKMEQVLLETRKNRSFLLEKHATVKDFWRALEASGC